MQVTQSISIAANTTDNNVLDTLGLRAKQVPGAAGALYAVSLLATGSAAGLEHSLFIGQDQPVERSVVNAQNRIPVVPDDAVTPQPIAAESGEQIQIEVTNTTGGALTYVFTLMVEPVG